jgi:hypothetical protein
MPGASAPPVATPVGGTPPPAVPSASGSGGLGGAAA